MSADGFFPQLPDHPLHADIYGSLKRPNERGGAWRCGGPIDDLTGQIVGSGTRPRARFEGDVVRRDAGATPLFVNAQTVIEGFDQFGLPRLLEGDRIQATVRECSASGGRLKVVPDDLCGSDRVMQALRMTGTSPPSRSASALLCFSDSEWPGGYGSEGWRKAERAGCGRRKATTRSRSLRKGGLESLLPQGLQRVAHMARSGLQGTGDLT